MKFRLFLTALLPLFAAPAPAQIAPMPQTTTPAVDIAPLKEAATRLIAEAEKDDTAYQRLAYLSDRIGNRLSGSASLEAAIRWAVSEMKRDGLDNVHTEKVMVPHWVRGAESVELLEPTRRPLTMLGLGNSVGTRKGGMTAEVVVVKDFAEMEQRGAEAIKGKIVCYNAPYVSYGQTVAYRTNGPSQAAKLGAVGVLVRSVGPVSLRTPHTGTLHYNDDAPQIPAAAITIEDAETLARMQTRGEKIWVHLTMEAKMLPDAESANVVAEIRGREKPEEVIVVGGHLDSWDVGTGSTDDGGGCLATWEAVRLMKKLGLRPRRTVRVVLFTNEENGARGGAEYSKTHQAEMANHVLAIESDGGVTQPKGFGITGNEIALAQAQALSSLLTPIGADRITVGGGGTDIGPMGASGVPLMGLSVDESHYFDIHHTQADTFDKIDAKQLAHCVATIAVMAYGVAEMPARLGH